MGRVKASNSRVKTNNKKAIQLATRVTTPIQNRQTAPRQMPQGPKPGKMPKIG